jgi:hypothetical protein
MYFEGKAGKLEEGKKREDGYKWKYKLLMLF